jgi:hypothetical protein
LLALLLEPLMDEDDDTTSKISDDGLWACPDSVDG